jgi:hypothetical protein
MRCREQNQSHEGRTVSLFCFAYLEHTRLYHPQRSHVKTHKCIHLRGDAVFFLTVCRLSKELRTLFATIVATVALMPVGSDVKRQRLVSIVEKMVASGHEHGDSDALLKKSMQGQTSLVVSEIVTRVLNHTFHDVDDDSVPAKAVPRAVQSLQELKLIRGRNFAEVLLGSRQLPMKILLSLSTAVDQEPRALGKQLIFQLFATVIHSLEEGHQLYLRTPDATLGPFYLRLAITTCTRTLALNCGFAAAVVDFLKTLLTTALKFCPDEVGENLADVVNAVLYHLRQEDSLYPPNAIDLLEMLVCPLSADVKEFIVQLDPFPATTQFRRLREAYEHCVSSMSVTDELDRFVKLKSSSQLHSRITALQQLQALVDEKRDELTTPALSRLMRALHKLSVTSDDVTLKGEICRLLGHVGAFNFKSLALDSPRNVIPRAQTTTGRRARPFSSTEEKYLLVCSTLAALLFDDDVLTMRAAATSLAHICCRTEILNLAAKTADRPFWKYLTPLLLASAHEVAIRPQDGSLPRDIVDLMQTSTGLDWRLWDAYLHDTELWLRAVTCDALLKCSDDTVLMLCHFVCSQSAKACEQLLGAIILNLLRYDATQSRNEQLSRSINHTFELLAASQNASSDSLSFTLFRVLDCLRETPREASIAQGTHRSSSNGGAAAGGSSSKAALAASLTPWHNNFWLDVNYLLAARAALNSSAIFTCIFYLELWKERCLDPKPEELLDYKRMLANAYSLIAEPDSIHGVCFVNDAADHGATQVAAYIHNGQISSALGAQCRLLTQQRNAGQVDATLCSLLHDIGYEPLFELALQRLADEAPIAATAPVTELYYEAAWRQKRWQTASLMGLATASGNSTASVCLFLFNCGVTGLMDC